MSHLFQYSNLFIANGIDESVLPDLDHESLISIGITNLGDRLKLLRAKKKSSKYYLTDIEILSEIGSGAFGKVYKGIWQGKQYQEVYILCDPKIYQLNLNFMV